MFPLRREVQDDPAQQQAVFRVDLQQDAAPAAMQGPFLLPVYPEDMLRFWACLAKDRIIRQQMLRVLFQKDHHIFLLIGKGVGLFDQLEGKPE